MPNGIVLDDDRGEYAGEWVSSAKQSPLVGPGYRHDDNRDQGSKSARFTPDMPTDGEYEVRLIYVATANRASNARVMVRHSNGETSLVLNQRESCLENGVPRAAGRFRFTRGKNGFVELRNDDADGFVVVDAVQFVPVEIAAKERKGELDAGFRGAEASDRREDTDKNVHAASVAVSPLTREMPGNPTAPPSAEPVMLAQSVRSADVDGRNYDFVVIGGTASGVACAVRAAREGCSVLLVQHNRHIGGMLANGLMQWDALYGGPRAPLFTELLRNIEKDAIARFGKDSKSHQIIRHTHEHYPVGWVEPHVMERECHRLVADAKNVTLLLEHYPVAAERDGALLKCVTLRAYGTTHDVAVKAAMFADATYEGDLLALAKVPYRVGREARAEYDEPHAGKVFVNIDHRAPESVVKEGLNIRAYGSRQGGIDQASPFTADGYPQAYNYRFCVTRNPDNRVMLTEPPPGYNRNEYVNYERKSIATNAGPNLKSHMNSPILPGENHEYPEAAWPEREKIIARHRNFGLGLIWFLQNDESVPAGKRAEFRQWGLARDEFPDNSHIPYEMYVREARRLVGRHVITEHDGMLAKDYARAPIHPDSVAVTDWYMDSHSCTTDSRPGFKYDGKLILTEESRPMQVPYRALLPQGVDNLLVPVCLSSTHVAWGALRLEPVWMQTGEAAGWAAALSKSHQTIPGKLNSEVLLRTLVAKRHLVSFFNDLKVDAQDSWIEAAQYFATKGFFHDYNVRPLEPLTSETAAAWIEGWRALQKGKLDAASNASMIAKAEKNRSAPVSAKAWRQMLGGSVEKTAGDQMLKRGEALRMMFARLGQARD